MFEEPDSDAKGMSRAPVIIDSSPMVDVVPAIFVARNRANGYLDLDDQKKAFCIAYVTNGYNHRLAASTVGRSPDSGVRIKREPLVAAYINDLMQEYLAESIVTKQTLDTYLDELEDIAMGRVAIPMITGAGDEITATKFHADLAMKVYNEKAKLHGVVEDDSKGGAVSVTINVGSLKGESIEVINE